MVSVETIGSIFIKALKLVSAKKCLPVEQKSCGFGLQIFQHFA